MSRARTTLLPLPPIEIGTRLTNFGGLDLIVEGTASGGTGLVAWGPNAAAGGRMMAVKLVRPDLLAGRTAAERARLRADFEREALAWCHVWPHAAIISANALTRLPGWDNLPVLALEYAPHGNLRAMLMRGHQPGSHLPLATAFAWSQMIAAGLAAIHMPDPEHERPQPLVHCDLKPENVLLDAQGRALLTDLGLTRAYAEADTGSAPPGSGITDSTKTTKAERQARIARMRAALIQAGLRPPDPDAPAPDAVNSPDTGPDAGNPGTATVDLSTRSVRVPPLPTAHAIGSRGPVAGTPQYMAPEQWLGMDAVGPATDTYALGVLLFELFAGVDAFPIVPDLRTALAHGDVVLAWYEAHRQGPRLTLSDPAVAALAEGPLNDLLEDAAGAAGAEGTERAREVLDGLERLVAACLAGAMERRPTAEQVRARLATLAEQVGLGPLDIPEVAPHTSANEANFWSNLGVTAGNLGQHEEKLRLCRRAVELDPGDPINQANLGVALTEVGMLEDALAAFTQAQLQLHREAKRWSSHQLVASILTNQGTVLRQLGRLAEAITAYQASLELVPDSADTLHNLGAVYWHWSQDGGTGLDVRIARLQRAGQYARRALQLAPNLRRADALLSEVEAELRRHNAI